MSIFIAIGLAVPEKKIFEGFYLVCILVTWIINIYIGSHFLKMLHVKFGFYWPSGFREGDLRIFL